MSDEEREKIFEKRSSMRSWRERGGKVPSRGQLIGISFIVLIFISLIASSILGVPEDGSSPSAEQPEKTAAPTPAATQARTSNPVLQASIPAPSIRINSPQNMTYDTSTPPLDFIVAGSGLDKVLLSVDGGAEIEIPHDGTVAKIDFARGNPLFIDDFSGTTKGRWVEGSNWKVEGGRYITTGGTASFGSTEWSDYIIEAKTKINSGRDVSIDLRWDGQSNHYRVQTANAYNSFLLHKIDSQGYTNLASTKLYSISPSNWNTWKIDTNDSKIRAFINDIPYIEYTDSNKPYLKGNLRLRVVNTNVEYDHIQIYKPLSEGIHNVAISASNTAGNVSSQTIYFTINTTMAEAGKNVTGKIGVPVVKSGLEITVKSTAPGNQYTSIWLNARNLENTDKPFKLGPGNIVIDNNGQQYESIKIPKSAEIAQTDLYAGAMREGAIYFDKLSDQGRSLKKLVLYVNGEKLEFMLDAGG